MFKNLEKVIQLMGLRGNDCHGNLERDFDYKGLGLGGGAICVEELMLLAGICYAEKPHVVIELGTSQGASTVGLGAVLKDIMAYTKDYSPNVLTVDLALHPPLRALEISNTYQLPIQFINKTDSISFINDLEVDRNLKYLIFSDTDIKVRPLKVEIALNKFPAGTTIVVHDTSSEHPFGPMDLKAKLHPRTNVLQFNTPRGISVVNLDKNLKS